MSTGGLSCGHSKMARLISHNSYSILVLFHLGKVIPLKLSTKGRYALRLMLDLALQPEGVCVPLRTVSDRQEISLKYLEQIVTPLARQGFVHSVRGAQGGYQLCHPPAYYTVGMILRTIEGSLAPIACLTDNAPPCPRQALCVTVDVYRRIDAAIDSVVDHITLEDLCCRQHEKWQAAGMEPPQKESQS